MNTVQRRRLALFAPAAALGLALPMVLPSMAHAATGAVTRYGSVVGYSAGGATANSVTFSLSGGHLVVTDSGGLFAGPGCARISATVADCGAGATAINGTTRDLGDSLTLAAPVPGSVDTGSGNDTVNARNGVADRIACGEGTDTVQADLGDLVSPDCEVVTR